MPDELAGHSGDGRQAATLQQLSITHAVGLHPYFMPPLSNVMKVTQVDWYAIKTCSYCLIHPYVNHSSLQLCIKKKILFMDRCHLTHVLWSIKYNTISYTDHISPKTFSDSSCSRLALKSLPQGSQPDSREVLSVTCLPQPTVKSVNNYIIVHYKHWEGKILWGKLALQDSVIWALFQLAFTFGCVWEVNGVCESISSINIHNEVRVNNQRHQTRGTEREKETYYQS